MLNYILLGIIGFAAGGIVSAGTFALITSTGLMTRFADKTHTAKYVQCYETVVILGGSILNAFWVFNIDMTFLGDSASWILGIAGMAYGIFLGCLAVSLAEELNATAIFARRAKLAIGLSFIILAVALGKSVGAYIHLLM